MSATLNLFESLLGLARRYSDQGRLRDAFNVLESLVSFPNLPALTAEKANADLAEIHLKRRRYNRARRHLTAAVGFSPNNAHYHYLLAVACRFDDRDRLERAAKHYRRALELDPDNAKCMSEYGLLLVREGCIEQGLAYLRKAVDAAPADVKATARLVKGMRLAGLPEEARQAAKSALFRNPRSAKFLQFWRDFQFRIAMRQQQADRREEGRSKPRPTRGVLPFVRLVRDEGDLSAAPEVRRDTPETLSPPHFPRVARRHVQ